MQTTLLRHLCGAVALFTCTAVSRAQAPLPPARSAAPRASLAGTVQDASGAIIPGAAVVLKHGTAVVTSLKTDSAGSFRLPQPAPGDYTLTVSLPGFSTLAQPLHIGSTPVPPLALTLAVADVSTNVEVNADRDVPLSDPATNSDATSVSADDMKNLPIFDADIVSTLSAFLDVGASGEGGPTLVIDGVESKSVGVSPSAIERVSINEDPYSARYRDPGRGQIEIITKSTADRFHGEFSFTFRDSALNATNYFAVTKPRQQRRIYEGFLTGPMPAALPNSSFLFSFTRKEADNQEQVDATIVPTVQPAVNVPSPQRSTNLTMKVAHQYNDHHSGYLLYRFYDNKYLDQNVGGLTQQSAGFAAYNFDMDITFHDDLTLSAHALNQFNILFERNLDRTISDVHAPQVNVQGYGTFGSAQNDQYNTENNPNISDIFDLTLSTHIPQEIKFGFQMPNLGRRILEDETNRQGTYTFGSVPNCTPANPQDTHCSAAAAFAAGQPESFSIQQGQTRFEVLYAQPGAFFLDQIQLTPRLTVIPGVRYDFQSAIPQTRDAIEPHLSLAYVLDKDHGFVLRTGGAVYVRRVGVNVNEQIARYSSAAERSLLITANLCYPNISACNPLAAQPPSLFNYAPDIKSPAQGYFSLSLERQLNRQSTLTLAYKGYRGWHALRSIDVNAPLPPFTGAARPNPNLSQSLQLNSGGYQKTDAFTLNWRGRIGHYASGLVQYTLQHADADTQWSTFTPQNMYDPNAEWSRTNYDQRQSLSLFTTLLPDKPFTLGIGFYNNTALPYTITTGTDDYHTGLFNARPAGVARNSVQGGSYQDLQVRLNYTHKLRPLYKGEAAGSDAKDSPTALTFSVSSFNTLNRPNFQDYVGVITSANFMHPTQASTARRLQLSAAYNF